MGVGAHIYKSLMRMVLTAIREGGLLDVDTNDPIRSLESQVLAAVPASAGDIQDSLADREWRR